jgi:hypothetical protein
MLQFLTSRFGIDEDQQFQHRQFTAEKAHWGKPNYFGTGTMSKNLRYYSIVY